MLFNCLPGCKYLTLRKKLLQKFRTRAARGRVGGLRGRRGKMQSLELKFDSVVSAYAGAAGRKRASERERERKSTPALILRELERVLRRVLTSAAGFRGLCFVYRVYTPCWRCTSVRRSNSARQATAQCP
jgi:hypothetical protein